MSLKKEPSMCRSAAQKWEMGYICTKGIPKRRYLDGSNNTVCCNDATVCRSNKMKLHPSFLIMCASPCYYSGNRWLKNIQASTPLFTDVHGPHLNEGSSKNEDIFESLTKNVSVCTI